ncbi:hypothetical protein B0H11DRAFT_1940908 [Mycena galericulata]|nr:hypothetical protein B0H11DRAFT_1940908 [Mycena galericulata]
MSDSGPSAGKRRRMDSEPHDPDSGSTPVVRSKIWMPYGDVVLQAESTTQFRVNRDVLAHQSSVFADMFAVPQPPNEPSVEGCSIIHVSDSANDWELLLDVIYHPQRQWTYRSVLEKIDFYRGMFADLLKLAYECDIRSSIPTMALACLQTTRLEILFGGVKRDDGSSVILSDTIKLALALAVEKIVLFQRESLAWPADDSDISHILCQS